MIIYIYIYIYTYIYIHHYINTLHLTRQWHKAANTQTHENHTYIHYIRCTYVRIYVLTYIYSTYDADSNISRQLETIHTKLPIQIHRHQRQHTNVRSDSADMLKRKKHPHGQLRYRTWQLRSLKSFRFLANMNGSLISFFSPAPKRHRLWTNACCYFGHSASRVHKSQTSALSITVCNMTFTFLEFFPLSSTHLSYYFFQSRTKTTSSLDECLLLIRSLSFPGFPQSLRCCTH